MFKGKLNRLFTTLIFIINLVVSIFIFFVYNPFQNPEKKGITNNSGEAIYDKYQELLFESQIPNFRARLVNEQFDTVNLESVVIESHDILYCYYRQISCDVCEVEYLKSLTRVATEFGRGKFVLLVNFKTIRDYALFTKRYNDLEVYYILDDIASENNSLHKHPVLFQISYQMRFKDIFFHKKI